MVRNSVNSEENWVSEGSIFRFHVDLSSQAVIVSSWNFFNAILRSLLSLTNLSLINIMLFHKLIIVVVVSYAHSSEDFKIFFRSCISESIFDTFHSLITHFLDWSAIAISKTFANEFFCFSDEVIEIIRCISDFSIPFNTKSY